MQWHLSLSENCELGPGAKEQTRGLQGAGCIGQKPRLGWNTAER